MVTIGYPAASPMYSVSLAGPEFFDTLRRSQSNVLSTLRSGEVENNQADKIQYYSCSYTFRGMSRTTRDALLQLAEEALGQAVLLTDYLTNNILCYISNEDIEIVTLQDDCHYDVRLQFMWA